MAANGVWQATHVVNLICVPKHDYAILYRLISTNLFSSGFSSLLGTNLGLRWV